MHGPLVGRKSFFLTVLAKIPRKVKLQKMMIVMNQTHLKLTQKLRGIRKLYHVGRSAAFLNNRGCTQELLQLGTVMDSLVNLQMTSLHQTTL